MSTTPTPEPAPTPEQIQHMIETAVADALASQKSTWSWAAIRGNKYFVTFTSALGGAAASQIYEAVKAGGFVWNKQAITAMIVSAVGTAATAVYHLYTQPNPPTSKETS